MLEPELSNYLPFPEERTLHISPAPRHDLPCLPHLLLVLACILPCAVHLVSCPGCSSFFCESTLPRRPSRASNTGKLLISLELIPKENADAQPVGSGRNEPNQNPYLPPPAGRMKFSFNPFRLSMSLLGPKAFYKVRKS